MPEVIVVGAGVGGLSCAAYLAQAGLDVLVLEAQDHVGGACHTTEQSGFRFEDGAIWLSMDYVCRRVFAELGADFDACVPTIKIDVSTRCLLPGGETFDFTPDADAVATEVARLSPADAPRFRSFMAEMARRGEFVAGDLYNRPLDWRGLLEPTLWRHLGFLLASYQGLVRGAFRDERVRLAFARPTLYLGLPPARCPAAFALSAYGEIAGGLRYPYGGMGRIPAALVKLLTGFGATLRTGTPVDHFIIDDHRISGVQLSNGESLRARAVISNAHVQPTYLHMVGRAHLPARVVRKLEALQLSLTYFGVQLGLDYVAEGPANIPALPPLSEMEAFWRTATVDLPTRLYPNVALAPANGRIAPAGKSVVSIYHAAPRDPGAPVSATSSPGGWTGRRGAGWETAKEAFAERLLTAAEANTGLQLRGHILARRLRTPADLEHENYLPGGAIYGLAPTLRQSGPFRPANRSPWIGGLYLTGHTTHPGLGVASVMASGAMTARTLLQDLGRPSKLVPQ
ncbi:MAG: phytoene desaturase family protein [Anaerolineales bacterium]